MFETINTLIVDISKDPFNPVLSFDVAREYEAVGQTASAISFYLRTAEYGYDTHPEYVYTALLKSANCFKDQKNRENTVLNLMLKAIAYSPDRPEAWFVLSQYYERTKKWQESYTAAETGLVFTGTTAPALPMDVGYWGEYTLQFQKAVSGWWVGRKDEALKLFKDLLTQEIHQIYRSAILFNLQKIG
jgi:tetratricopeptide (TPR) repeat protein